MFSETRYALNGDLRVAYRASREGPRDIVFVATWFTNCEVVPELPPIQGWIDAMTSVGRLIFFDQPGTGASDPIAADAMPTLEQWADSITAVLDDLGSREAVLIASPGALAPAALFAAAHPSRTTSLVVLEGFAELVGEVDVRAVLPTIRVPTLVVHHTDDPIVAPAKGRYVADNISGAKYVELPGRNMYHFVEPWRDSFQEIAEFLTGEQPDVADDRVLATVLFTDIVDSTRRAAEIGDRNWHALLDAHDAVVRAQLNRFRGREVNTSGDGFLATFDGPQRAIRCAMAIRDAVQALGIEVRAGLHTGECEIRGDDIGGIAVHIGARVSALAGPNDVLVSSTLRDLVIGSGIEFEDHGTHQPKVCRANGACPRLSLPSRSELHSKALIQGGPIFAAIQNFASDRRTLWSPNHHQIDHKEVDQHDATNRTAGSGGARVGRHESGRVRAGRRHRPSRTNVGYLVSGRSSPRRFHRSGLGLDGLPQLLRNVARISTSDRWTQS